MGLPASSPGDILAVTTDRKWLSFMRSYPNASAAVQALRQAYDGTDDLDPVRVV